MIFALCVSGVLSGVIALLGMRRYGRKGILSPAIIGIGLWVLLIALALVSVIIVKRSGVHRCSTVLAPATHALSATRVVDRETGFSFDLPEGFQPFPSADAPKGFRYAYFRAKTGEANRVLLVRNLGGWLPREHLKPEQLPAGKLLTSVSWRGLSVDGITAREVVQGVDYLSLNIQIPLRREAIQLTFGAPYNAFLELRHVAEQVLSSLEGETNW